MKQSRNDPCYCGSGKKFKRCHALVRPQPRKGRGATRLVCAGCLQGGGTYVTTVQGYHVHDKPACKAAFPGVFARLEERYKAGTITPPVQSPESGVVSNGLG
jgi:hypothetical protein